MDGNDDYRWGIWLAILSLNVTTQFHDEMRVPVPNSYLTGPMRARIRLNRTAMVNQMLTSNESLVAAILSDLDSARPGGGSDFQKWYKDTATIGWGERQWWAPWHVVLREWGFGPQPGQLLGQRWFMDFMAVYLRHMKLRELRAITGAARRSFLSEWDAEMFALHRYYEIDGEEEGIDPFIPVINTIEFVRLRDFHALAVPNLDETNLMTLDTVARETMKRIDYSDETFRSFGLL